MTPHLDGKAEGSEERRVDDVESVPVPGLDHKLEGFCFGAARKMITAVHKQGIRGHPSWHFREKSLGVVVVPIHQEYCLHRIQNTTVHSENARRDLIRGKRAQRPISFQPDRYYYKCMTSTTES